MRKTSLIVLIAGALALGQAAGAGSAAADSCWNHNGSTMRLQANGQQRTFSYENPKSSLRNAGVGPGTILFEGRNTGNYYIGTARVFSRFCPGAPLLYSVEGPVSNGDKRVTVSGSREIHEQCAPTGQWTTDTLVFTYMHQC